MTSSPRISKASSSATSSPGSDSGPSASGAPAGQTIDLFGPVPVPAVPSRPRASAKASPTRATFGRNGFGSSASAGLTASLVSSLIRRSRGSILFKVTLRASATPSGRVLWRLAVSADRTSASELASWPTPQFGDGLRGGAESHLDGRRWNLRDFVELAAWATPAWRDYRTPNLEPFAERGGGKQGEQLSNQVIHSGPALIGSSAEIAAGARLNPALARSLMRVPPEWCDCAAMATRSTSKRSRT